MTAANLPRKRTRGLVINLTREGVLNEIGAVKYTEIGRITLLGTRQEIIN